MKNYVLLALITSILFVGGCSSKSESDPTFNPPSWIQGAWVQSSELGIEGGYKFTSDGIYFIFFSEVIDYNLGKDPSADEITNTDSQYSFKLKGNDDQDVITTCIQSSAEEIECTSDSTTNVFTHSDAY